MTAVLKLAIPTDLDKPLAMAQTRRPTTGGPVVRPAQARASRPCRGLSVFEQTVQAAAAWAYVTPFLLLSPLHAAPPLWIAMLLQLPAATPPLPPGGRTVLDTR